MSIKKLFLGAAVAVALITTGFRIVKTYKRMVPVAQPGHCLEVKAPDGSRSFRLMVLQNDPKSRSSYVIVEVAPGVGLPTVAKYEELRELGAKEVSCD